MQFKSGWDVSCSAITLCDVAFAAADGTRLVLIVDASTATQRTQRHLFFGTYKHETHLVGIIVAFVDEAGYC